MANPTQLGDADTIVLGGNFAASSIESSVTLDPDREYSFRHNGVDADGTDGTETIYFGLDNQVTADDSAEDHKVPLADGVAVTIGPGVTTLYFATASGTPTFSAVVGPRLFGNW